MSSLMPSSSARRISDEPLINAVHRHVATFFLVVYALGLLYVSFVPFDFTTSPQPNQAMRALSGMSLTIFAVSDLLVNVVMYMPLGFLAMLAVRRLGFAKEAAIISCLGVGTLLSFAIEKGQGWTISRVSAWSDIAANSFGTFLGITAYLFLEPSMRAALHHVRGMMRKNMWIMTAQLFIAAVLIVQLRPYDVVVDPARTAKMLRDADSRPMARWHALPSVIQREIGMGRRVSMTELPREQWDYVLDRAADVASYAMLAAILSIGLIRSGRSRVSAAFSSGATIATVAATITLVRVFLVSHGLDTLHFCCALAGWPIGCMIGWACAERDKKYGGMIIAALFVGVLGMVVLQELAPFEWSERHGSISWGPFFRHFGSRVNDAFMDISGDVLRYGLIAGMLAVAARRVRLPWRVRSAAIVGSVAAIAVGLEYSHLFIPSRHADMTSVYMAVVGGAMAVVAVRWAGDYRASRVVVANDALTGALIEGPSYDKSRPAGITPGSRRSGASRTDRAESHSPV